MTHTLLAAAHVPLTLWVEAALTSVHLINLLPTPTLGWTTPYTLLFGRPLVYSHLRTFGCICFPYLGNYVHNKLMPRSVECVFVGYSASHKGYRCLDRATGRVYISRHVVFTDDAFPFATSLGPQSNTHVELILYPTTASPPVHPLPTVGLSSPAAITPHHDIGPLPTSTCDPRPDNLAAPSST